MLVGIHKDLHKGFTKMLERYEEILKFNGVESIRMDINEPDFWEKVKELDLFIFHWYGTGRQRQVAQTILPIIEGQLGIKCFPSSRANWLYDDKVREYYFLRQNSLPVIPTWIFWNEEDAFEWLKTAELPVVFKLSGGASSENVVLVKDRLYGQQLIKRMFGRGIISGHVPGFESMKWKNMFTIERIKRIGGKVKRRLVGEEGNPFEERHKNYVFFQKFLSNNPFDTRVHVIGRRAFPLIRFVREKDFRASGSGKYYLRPDKVDSRCVNIGFDISKRFGFYSMTYDFLYDSSGQPLISEMSYTRPDWGVWICQGYWDDQMNWHEGHFWFQYVVLMDMLNLPDLKQPDMKPEVSDNWPVIEGLNSIL